MRGYSSWKGPYKDLDKWFPNMFKNQNHKESFEKMIQIFDSYSYTFCICVSESLVVGIKRSVDSVKSAYSWLSWKLLISTLQTKEIKFYFTIWFTPNLHQELVLLIIINESIIFSYWEVVLFYIFHLANKQADLVHLD